MRRWPHRGASRASTWASCVTSPAGSAPGSRSSRQRKGEKLPCEKCDRSSVADTKSPSDRTDGLFHFPVALAIVVASGEAHRAAAPQTDGARLHVECSLRLEADVAVHLHPIFLGRGHALTVGPGAFGNRDAGAQPGDGEGG